MDDIKIKKLAKVHPIIRQNAIQFLKRLEEKGIEAGVFSGYRSFEQQQSLYDQGRNQTGEIIDKNKIITNAKPGFSLHNFGLAVDIVRLENGNWTWEGDYDIFGEIGEKFGFEWGGDWAIKDKCHFQMTFEIPLYELREIYYEEGLEKVWEKIDDIVKKKNQKLNIN